ncbi:MAG: alpha/beta hydrolase domain-containing protein [Chloroflexota bacterium]
MAVTRLEIQERRPVSNGERFGETGPYESLRGIIHFAVSPGDPALGVIADLNRAPTEPDGLVHFSADFHVLKPVQSDSAGKLLFDVINRGRKLVLSTFNLAPRGPETDQALQMGDGFLMRHGFTVLWCGWQHDVPDGPGQMRIHVPDALDSQGQPLVGPAYVQYQLNAVTPHMPLCDRGHTPLPAASLDTATATLTVRDDPDSPTVEIDRAQWRFGRINQGAFSADPRFLTIDGGFQPGKVYEIVYNTVGAPIVGLGFVAMRDATAFLKYGSAEAGNPCAGSIAHAYAYGASQTGRYVRELLYLGLNSDEQDRPVFDGVHAHTGSSRRGEFNLRFGQPSTNILRAPGNLFPFTYDPQDDPITGERGGLLDRLRTMGRVPRVIATNSGMEYWWSGASLGHSDVQASVDIEPPPEVRQYFLSCTQHGAGGLPLAARTEDGIPTLHPMNTIDYRPLLRAALLHLDRWVSAGVEPPPSQFPRLADGTAVTRESLRVQFEHIPGATFPSVLPTRRRLNFGPEAGRGVMAFPPEEGPAYITRVSAVDTDANDLAGVRPLDVRAPLATYMGWNPRHPDVGGQGQFYFGNPLVGSTIPFARTEAERSAVGDPRPSLEHRYGSRQGYLEQVRGAAQAMIAEGWLLAEDLQLALTQAMERYDAFTAADAVNAS